MASSSILKQQVSSSQDPMDITCINTIRTLAMDAVQQANSGHPGTPMALAPVAYLLWQQLSPVRPRRSGLAQPRPLRAVLRARVDAALLHAPPRRREVGQRGLRDPGRARRLPGRHQEVPPARQQMPGPSGISAHVGRRDHHRPARPGSRQQRGHGDGRAVAGALVTTSPALKTCSITTSTPSAATAT